MTMESLSAKVGPSSKSYIDGLVPCLYPFILNPNVSRSLAGIYWDFEDQQKETNKLLLFFSRFNGLNFPYTGHASSSVSDFVAIFMAPLWTISPHLLTHIHTSLSHFETCFFHLLLPSPLFIIWFRWFGLKNKEEEDDPFNMGNSCVKPVANVNSSNFSGSTKSSKTQQNYNSLGKKAALQGSASNPVRAISNNLKSFSFNDLKEATKNFREENFIGEGGFGRVFKGWMNMSTFAPTKPGSGVVVAIKQLKPESFQGHKEWLAEVNYLGQLHHENLVKLIGYCSEDRNRLLVYEFMQKGSLENHLFRKGVQPISWATRINIAIGVARGLAFLHSLDANVIYRDLKASNILLDSDFHPKLSDFGLARDGPTGDNTHVSTRVIGTQGYAAPEYVATGHLTPRSDVYSFGVVLLELLTGRRALEDGRPGSIEETLVDWAKPFLNDNRRVLRIMDTRLGGQYSKKGAQSAAALALQCLTSDPRYRPPMVDVLAALEALNSSSSTPRTPKSFSENISNRHSSPSHPQKPIRHLKSV